VFKGYELRQFANAFSRYLDDSSVTQLRPAVQSQSAEFLSVTHGGRVTNAITPKAAPHNACNRVTDQIPGNGARAWTKPLPSHRDRHAMSAAELLTDLTSRGITLEVDGTDLRYYAVESAMTPRLREQIKAQKAETDITSTETERTGSSIYRPML
jgi:hypothetical protein